MNTTKSASRLKLPAILLISSILFISCSSPSGDQNFEYSYFDKLGVDTIAVEQFNRSENGFEGRYMNRIPVTRAAYYTAKLDNNGSIEQFELNWEVKTSSPNVASVNLYDLMMQQTENGYRFIRTGQENTDTTVVENIDGALPDLGLFPMPIALLDQAIYQAIDTGKEKYEIDFINPVNGNTRTRQITLKNNQEAEIDFFGSPMSVKLDDSGRIVKRDGRNTTLKMVAARQENPVHFERLFERFSSLDDKGEGIAQASPGTTVTEEIHGANIEVRYSQPAKRGRKIWGGLVPYDKVWRTGANAATHLTTDKTLVFGDTEIKPGTYTIFSIFHPDEAHLIINNQTDISGTQHDPEYDLTRMPMDKTGRPGTQERFKIELRELDTGGEIMLIWDQTAFITPFDVK